MPKIAVYGDARMYLPDRIKLYGPPYGMVICTTDPPTMRELRKVNPTALVAYSCTPQMVPLVKPPAYDWNPMNRVARMAHDYDWILRQPSGAPVATWGNAWLAWGEKRADMMVAQRVALEIINDARGARVWTSWHEGGDEYNLIVAELLCERMSSWFLGPQQVDLDGDGEADPIDAVNESFRRGTARFLEVLRNECPNLPVVAGGDETLPDLSLLDGTLIEDAFRRRRWRDDFIGRPGSQRGYVISDNQCRRGSSLTILKAQWDEGDRDEHTRNRFIWMGCATARLLDGWYLYVVNTDRDPRAPLSLNPVRNSAYSIQDGEAIDPTFRMEGSGFLRSYARGDWKVLGDGLGQPCGLFVARGTMPERLTQMIAEAVAKEPTALRTQTMLAAVVGNLSEDECAELVARFGGAR
jgi:hypothetical protein